MKQNEAVMYSSIQGTFKEFYNLARLGLKKNWKKLTSVERAQAGRSLVFMRGLAINPARYFSRANTGAAWVKRAHDYANAHGIVPANIFQAYYIVEDPKSIVSRHAQAAWLYNADMGKMFYRFCKDVQNWEYGRTSEEAKEVFLSDGIAEQILAQHDKIASVCRAMEPSKAQQWVQNKIKSLSK